jgi:hypothetical protein
MTLVAAGLSNDEIAEWFVVSAGHGQNARQPGDGEARRAGPGPTRCVCLRVRPRPPRPAPVGQYPAGRRRPSVAAPCGVSEVHPLGRRLNALHSRPLAW